MSSSEKVANITLYEAIGGEETVRTLVRRFYDLMENAPEGARARAVHPPSLQSAEQKLFEYLTGYLGGPQLYIEKYGHPRLRARHLIAPIGTAEIESWLACFNKALDETVEGPEIREIMREPITRLAWHMRNREEGGDA